MNANEEDLINNWRIGGKCQYKINSNRYHLTFEGDALITIHANSEDNHNETKEEYH